MVIVCVKVKYSNYYLVGSMDKCPDFWSVLIQSEQFHYMHILIMLKQYFRHFEFSNDEVVSTKWVGIK